MAIVGAMIVVAGLIALVLLFAFYIFPDAICPNWDSSGYTIHGETKDPIGELCQALR